MGNGFPKEISSYFMSQTYCGLVQMDTKFHDCSMSFIQYYLFSMLKHDMDFEQVQVMEFPWHLLRKWWDVHWIWSHYSPNCRRRHIRKSVSHFLQRLYCWECETWWDSCKYKSKT